MDFATPSTPQKPQKASSGPRIGLALGGGGARGFSHIHVIEAMVEMGLRPSLMAGTSIGAVVATGFATGIDAKEMVDYAERLVGSHKHALKLLISRRTLGILELFDIKRSGGALLKGDAVLELALPELLQHSFSTLTIPTRVVATDFSAMCQKVFDEGPVMPALAASIAMPSIISPSKINGRFYIDGGMTNPLPHDVIENDVDIVVACDVNGVRPTMINTAPTTAEVLFGSIQITLHVLTETKLNKHPPTVLVQPPIEDFRLLDFFKLKQILKTTLPIKEDVKRKLDAAITLYEQQKTSS